MGYWIFETPDSVFDEDGSEVIAIACQGFHKEMTTKAIPDWLKLKLKDVIFTGYQPGELGNRTEDEVVKAANILVKYLWAVNGNKYYGGVKNEDDLRGNARFAINSVNKKHQPVELLKVYLEDPENKPSDEKPEKSLDMLKVIAEDRVMTEGLYRAMVSYSKSWMKDQGIGV